MKNFFLAFVLLVSFLNYAQELRKPTEGKSLVYFVRSSSMGFLINFKYFDGEKYLGKFNHGYYLVYECEPGKHLFWSKSENIDYLEAELDAGKTYIVDSEPQMGVLKAGVKLMPFDNNPSNYKNSKRYDRKKADILESISNQKEYTISSEDLKEAEKDLGDIVSHSMEKYKRRKDDGKDFTKMPASMDYR